MRTMAFTVVLVAAMVCPTLAQEAAPAASADAQLKALQAEEQALNKQRDELRRQVRDIREKIAKGDGVAAERKAYEEADAAYDKAKETPEVAAARKPYEEARAAYEKARRAMPEYKAMEEAVKAFADKRHNTPEYQARIAATKERDKLRGQPGYEAADAAYKAAYEAYNKMKSALPEAEAEKKAKEAYETAAKALPEAKALAEAEKAYRDVSDKTVAGPRKARDDARRALDKKIDELFKADTDAAKAGDQLKQLDSQVHALHEKIRALKK